MESKFDREHARINKLKADWQRDPAWDIEDTPGFEAHHDELLAFRHAKEAEWKAEREARWAKKAEDLGVPGNLKLAAYVERLEQRIEELDRAVWRILNPNP